ncbi:MAG: ATP-binding cassette domain-containing protein [Dehalococcoidia bacterium]|nr:ATP-binding cassette domain-containing protein [Dehalococcoidia bacterium]
MVRVPTRARRHRRGGGDRGRPPRARADGRGRGEAPAGRLGRRTRRRGSGCPRNCRGGGCPGCVTRPTAGPDARAAPSRLAWNRAQRPRAGPARHPAACDRGRPRHLVCTRRIRRRRRAGCIARAHLGSLRARASTARHLYCDDGDRRVGISGHPGHHRHSPLARRRASATVPHARACADAPLGWPLAGARLPADCFLRGWVGVRTGLGPSPVPPTKELPASAATTLAVRGLTTRAVGRTGIDGVALEVPQRSVTAVLGGPGSGKSALLRAIAGLDRARHGVVEILRRDVTGLAPHRRGMGLVLQDPALFGDRSVAENIRYGLRVARLASAERELRVAEVTRALGLTQHRDSRIDDLSAVEQLAVAIWRAIALEPRVLLLDEPLVALAPSERAGALEQHRSHGGWPPASTRSRSRCGDEANDRRGGAAARLRPHTLRAGRWRPNQRGRERRHRSAAGG